MSMGSDALPGHADYYPGTPIREQREETMPLKLDAAVLHRLGVTGLTKDQERRLLKGMYSTLESRVGAELAARMSSAQLNEFETFYDSQDDEGAFQWLESQFPEYPDVVRREMSEMLAWVRLTASEVEKAIQGP